MSESKVTVTVVLYNSDDYIESCLDSVASSARSGLANVIAVNNCSPDDSVSIVESRFPWVRIINSEKNRGFAEGCNLAWGHVGGKYWLLFNPDASFIDPNGLEQLIDWMDRHPEVGAASPDIVDSNGISNFPARRFPTLGRLYFESLRFHKLLPKQWRAKWLMGSYWNRNDTTDADWVPGTAIIVRSDAVRQAGPLSDEFFMYGEDIEWCWRFKSHGWRIGFCSSVLVRHGDSTSSVKSWGGDEKERRMILGIFRAVAKMNGSWYAQLLWTSFAVLSRLESLNPLIGSDERSRRRKLADIYFEMIGAKNLT